MPYIKQDRREVLIPLIRELEIAITCDKRALDGELNFVISHLLWRLAYDTGGYYAMNRALGVLEAVKQEFYRQVIAPYEDKRKEENGDVYK